MYNVFDKFKSFQVIIVLTIRKKEILENVSKNFSITMGIMEKSSPFDKKWFIRKYN
jgi:hypothetical protein